MGQAVRTISVALCTRNGARFLREQLDSIAAQTLPVDEIVVGDDASSDATLDIVAAWATTHPAIRVVLLNNDPPLGVRGNFERTLLACTGAIIALSDQDDVWHPDKLERLVAALHEHPAALLVHSDARLVDADGAPNGTLLLQSLEATPWERSELAAGRALPVLIRRNLITGATAVLRSELLALAAPFPEHWVHDEWLAVVAACDGGVVLVDEPLVDYRQHGANEIGAVAPTLGHKVGRLRQSREERNTRLLARAVGLQARLADRIEVTPEITATVDGRVAHERMRSSLPVSRFGRIRPVLSSLRRGDYGRYGRGAMDVLRDLVQPV